MGILILALALRLWGLRFGLPDLYYWDEPTVVNRAVRFGSGDLNPHFFYYPGFYMYVLFGASGAYFVGGRLLGAFASAPEFAATYFTDPTGVYLTARATTALIGTLAVLAVYLLGKRFFSWRTGIIAALLLAVAPLHVTHSHIAITDVPHALLICCATVACQQVLVRGRLRDYLLSGALIGLGAATKYLAVLNVATLVLAHVLADDGWRKPGFSVARLGQRCVLSPVLWLGLLTSAVSFFVGSPYNILELSAFAADLRAQMALSAGDAQQGALLVRTFFRDFLGPASILALVGLAAMARKPTRQTLLFLCFPLLYALVAFRTSKSFARYLLPQSAFLAVAAAHALGLLFDWLQRKLGAAYGAAYKLALLAVTIAPPLAVSVSWDVVQAYHQDTRTTAARWTEQTLPAGSPIALQSLYDRCFDNVPVVTDRALERLERLLPASGAFASIRNTVLAAWRARPVYRDVGWSTQPAWLQRSGARYALLTNANGAPPAALSNWLRGSTHLLRRFEPQLPWPLAWLGPSLGEFLPVVPPTISIYELPAATR